MTAFTNEFWDLYIALLTLLSGVGCALRFWPRAGSSDAESTEDDGQPRIDGCGWNEESKESNDRSRRVDSIRSETEQLIVLAVAPNLCVHCSP
jgi:hypothetical protein